jgi:hypothetical protein
MYYCQFCRKESKKQNLRSLRIHEVWCKSNPNKSKNLKIPSRKGIYAGSCASSLTLKRKVVKERKEECTRTQKFLCKFCQKNCDLKKFRSSFLSLMCHESQCPDNPERIRKPITEETKEKIRKKCKGKKYTEEQKKKISDYMKKAVEQHPESYSSCNRYRAKRKIIDGVRFDSTWEFIFYRWAKDAGLNPQRCLESFSYAWEGCRKYFPDFYISSLDLYIEIKGQVTDRDKAKWNDFPKKLKVIMKDEIEEIKKGIFRGLV